MEKDKWIEDAFKEAQRKTPGAKQLADKVADLFKDDFPKTMTAFEMTYGHDKAMKIATLMFADNDIVTLCRCFFMTGYQVRMKEEKRGADNA